jgi:hypothetical protein
MDNKTFSSEFLRDFEEWNDRSTPICEREAGIRGEDAIGILVVAQKWSSFRTAFDEPQLRFLGAPAPATTITNVQEVWDPIPDPLNMLFRANPSMPLLASSRKITATTAALTMESVLRGSRPLLLPCIRELTAKVTVDQNIFVKGYIIPEETEKVVGSLPLETAWDISELEDLACGDCLLRVVAGTFANGIFDLHGVAQWLSMVHRNPAEFAIKCIPFEEHIVELCTQNVLCPRLLSPWIDMRNLAALRWSLSKLSRNERRTLTNLWYHAGSALYLLKYSPCNYYLTMQRHGANIWNNHKARWYDNLDRGQLSFLFQMQSALSDEEYKIIGEMYYYDGTVSRPTMFPNLLYHFQVEGGWPFGGILAELSHESNVSVRAKAYPVMYVDVVSHNPDRLPVLFEFPHWHGQPDSD